MTLRGIVQLHTRLQAHAATIDTATAAVGGSSWLAEWWDDMAYLEYRDSVAFYVSYFYQFSDDAARSNGVSRAASLITGFAAICQEVSSGQVT